MQALGLRHDTRQPAKEKEARGAHQSEQQRCRSARSRLEANWGAFSRVANLPADGEVLRRRLVSLTVSVHEVGSLVGDIRRWETRVATVVSVRNPKHSAEFRVRSGPFQRLLGDGWLPMPGWQRRLNESLVEWLHALERVRQLSLAERRRSNVP
jgi:hypothetical protein